MFCPFLHISVCLRGHSSCAPVLVLPVSVALHSPHPPTLKPLPSHCHNNTCRVKKKKKEKHANTYTHSSTVTDTKTTTQRCASEIDRVFPISTPQNHDSCCYHLQYTALQSYRQWFYVHIYPILHVCVCVSVCACHSWICCRGL